MQPTIDEIVNMVLFNKKIPNLRNNPKHSDINESYRCNYELQQQNHYLNSRLKILKQRLQESRIKITTYNSNLKEITKLKKQLKILLDENKVKHHQVSKSRLRNSKVEQNINSNDKRTARYKKNTQSHENTQNNICTCLPVCHRIYSNNEQRSQYNNNKYLKYLQYQPESSLHHQISFNDMAVECNEQNLQEIYNRQYQLSLQKIIKDQEILLKQYQQLLRNKQGVVVSKQNSDNYLNYHANRSKQKSNKYDSDEHKDNQNNETNRNKLNSNRSVGTIVKLRKLPNCVK